MEQDRNLEVQHSRERLGQIADLSVAQLAGTLDDWDIGLRDLNPLHPLASFGARWPAGATLVVITRGSVNVIPPRPLLFAPERPVTNAPDAHAFEAADELEIREQNFEGAIAALQALAQHAATRPEALLRIARIEHKMNRPEAALDTYRSLFDESGFNASGTPYALLAAAARCRILKELGRTQEASTEAEALRALLAEGRWRIPREAFEYYWSELHTLGASADQPPKSSLDFANAVSGVYERWQHAKDQGGAMSGRSLQRDSSLLLWNGSSDGLSALLTSPGWLDSNLKLPANSDDIRWKVLPLSAAATSSSAITRSLADAQLSGRIEFSTVQPIANIISSRHALWLVGVVLMLAVVLGSGYVLQRAITRELRVARLQSDFVAAVSHEFRTPLTTLRSITELLSQGRITDESRRRQSYVFLDRDTVRLQRLVEDLLDFGRMESGTKQNRVEPLDAFQSAQSAVDEVSEQAESGGFTLETNFEPVHATVRADGEALRRAVRNLIENAMKYSPECRTVWIDGLVIDRHVSISVRDRGMGIAPLEQRAIFKKFVRGEAAKKAGIKGTGIGLAMVQQISKAIGGEVRVESQVGVGSTFTVVLPLADK